MLIEVRKLVFSDDLLQAALLKQCAAQGMEIPNSKVQKLKIFGASPDAQQDTPEPVRIVMQFVTADPDKPYEVTLDEDLVLTALIAKCKCADVPLPRSAPKHLQLTNQGLAMIVSLTNHALDQAAD